VKKNSTLKIKVGNVFIGGGAPIVVQSMCNTDTRDIRSTVNQIKRLEKAGCELVRLAVPDMAAAKSVGRIKKRINIPLVADIHFSHELALECIKQGVDKLRINPGNIGNKAKIRQIILAAERSNVSIRVGVNAGSLEKEILKKYKNKVTPRAMVDSAMKHIKILEKHNFKNIIVSLKSSDIKKTIEAYRLISKKINYPLHVGITEAGSVFRGTIASSVGVGSLLLSGIGDTVRVSLTADPVEEVRVTWEILKVLKLRKRGISVTSCPACGRTEIDLVNLVKKIENAVKDIEKNMHVAVMGCVVNGPGEAKKADLAIVAGKKNGAIYKKGRFLKTVNEKNLLSEFIKEIKKFK